MDRTLLALREAVSDLKSAPRGGRKRWPRPTPEAIKELRERLKLSQAEFARKFGLDLASLKHWEGRRRYPEQASCLLLRMIECDANLVASLVSDAQRRVETEERQNDEKERKDIEREHKELKHKELV